MDIRGYATRVPAWAWFASVGVAGLAVLVWHHWAVTSSDDESWLDDGQPAVMLTAVSEKLPPPTRARCRTYPETLLSWPGTKIGDC